jgi:hypothetical protein
MPNPEMVEVIAKGLREGLPHPGNRENHQTAEIIRIPGMNPQGIPKVVLDQMAKEAGLPTSDMPTLVAEALINLIETNGDSEIVKKSELKELRERANSGYQVDGETNAGWVDGQGSMDVRTPDQRGEGV